MLVQGGLRMERMGGRDETRRGWWGKLKRVRKEAQKGLDRWNNSLFHLKTWVVKSAHAISSTSSCWSIYCRTCLREDWAAMDDDFPSFLWIHISLLASDFLPRLLVFRQFSNNIQMSVSQSSTQQQPHTTAPGLPGKFPSHLHQFLWNSFPRSLQMDGIAVVLICVHVFCSVRLCETVGWQGAAQVLDWSCLSCQSSQRAAAERPPRNRLHWVHGPRHLAPRSLQRWTQPGASVAPQHSYRWEEVYSYPEYSLI